MNWPIRTGGKREKDRDRERESKESVLLVCCIDDNDDDVNFYADSFSVCCLSFVIKYIFLT